MDKTTANIIRPLERVVNFEWLIRPIIAKLSLLSTISGFRIASLYLSNKSYEFLQLTLSVKDLLAFFPHPPK